MQCATCHKPIIPTTGPSLSKQSAYQHADGTGAGVGGAKAQWCETATGYVKVAPAPVVVHEDKSDDLVGH